MESTQVTIGMSVCIKVLSTGILLHILCLSIVVQTATSSSVFYCYDCNSVNEHCPGDKPVSGEIGKQVVETNCTAGQRCYTREYKAVSKTTIYRGCTKSIYIAHSLPKDGCYDFNGDLICLCSSNRCNKVPIGAKTGIALDAHLKTASGDIIPPTYKPRGNQKTIVCNVCNSGDKRGDENPSCLPGKTANYKTTWKQNCTGRCITKTNFLEPDIRVYRECSDIWYQFPQPFPPDGCYEWYGDTVCVCNQDLCNSAPIGKHKGRSLDYLTEDGLSGDASTTTLSRLLFQFTIPLMIRQLF